MPYCDSANKLLREAKRTTDTIPPYNDEVVRAVFRESRTLLDIVTRVAEEHQRRNLSQRYGDATSLNSSATSTPHTSTPLTPENMAGLLVHHLSLRRNKRCLLAYHHQRLERIKELAWGSGMTGGLSSSLPKETINCLSTNEQDFFRSYAEIGRRYGAEFADVDVLVPTTALIPPKELYITVRVVQDCGQILTETGPMTLNKGEEHFVKRSDVERLISQGVLRHIV